MTYTGLHLRDRFCAALIAAAGVPSDSAERELEDVIPVLIYRGRDGRRCIVIGPHTTTPPEDVQMILREAADNMVTR